MADILPVTEKDTAERSRLIREATQIFFETAKHQGLRIRRRPRRLLSNAGSGITSTTDPALFPSSPGRERRGDRLSGRLPRQFLGSERESLSATSHSTRPLSAPRSGIYPSHFHINVKPGHQGTGRGPASHRALLQALPGPGLARHSRRRRAQNRAPSTSTATCGFTPFAVPDARPRPSPFSFTPFLRRELA